LSAGSSAALGAGAAGDAAAAATAVAGDAAAEAPVSAESAAVQAEEKHEPPKRSKKSPQKKETQPVFMVGDIVVLGNNTKMPNTEAEVVKTGSGAKAIFVRLLAGKKKGEYKRYKPDQVMLARVGPTRLAMMAKVTFPEASEGHAEEAANVEELDKDAVWADSLFGGDGAP